MAQLWNKITGRFSADAPAPIMPVPTHPYSPSTIIVPGYTPNVRRDVELITAFAAAWIPILGSTWAFARWYNPKLKRQDQAKILWFMLCGTLHTFFEGYFVANHNRLGGNGDLFAELWKEYALSDSRYLASDTFVLAAEGVTIMVLGLLSYTMVYLTITRSPYRTPVQIMCSFGHIYSDTLYYATSLIDFYVKGIDHCRPEGYYFWVYYVGLNAIWIVVPLILLVQGISDTAQAFSALARMERAMQINMRSLQPNGKPVRTRPA